MISPFPRGLTLRGTYYMACVAAKACMKGKILRSSENIASTDIESFDWSYAI